MDWRDKTGFYKVGGQCAVCGSRHEIGMEPRFGYRVCEQHKDWPPTKIQEQKHG